MVKTEINIDTKGDRSIPKKIKADTDSSFFTEGGIVELPPDMFVDKRSVAIKVIKVTKQLTTSLTNLKAKIIVNAEIVVNAERYA